MSGLEIEISKVKEEWNEEHAAIEIFAAETSIAKPFEITKEDIPLLIDEIPILAVLAAYCHGETKITNAGELRNKETDRLSALIKNLNACGVQAWENEGGIVISGDEHFVPHCGSIEHHGDHRIAMAFSVLALRTKENVTISDASVVSISYPNFFPDLTTIAGSERIRIS